MHIINIANNKRLQAVALDNCKQFLMNPDILERIEFESRLGKQDLFFNHRKSFHLMLANLVNILNMLNDLNVILQSNNINCINE